MDEVKKLDKVAKKFKDGEEIQRLVLTQNEEQLNKALTLIYAEKQRINKNRFKRWIMLVVGCLIGFAISEPLILILRVAGFSLYSRAGLDDELVVKLGKDTTFNDLNIEELLVISYEYNSKSPRFFTKYFQ